MERITELIEGVSEFSGLSDQERLELAQVAIRKSYERNEYIAHYGDVWPYLFVVDTGLINVVKISPKGRVLGALQVQPEQVFWSPTLFDEGLLPAALEVKERSSIYLWHGNHILPLVQRNPEALWALCLMLMRRIRQASDFIEDLTFQPVAGRLARLIIAQFEDSTDLRIAREQTLDEMAAMIGTTPVMVCKILSRFAGDGLITVNRTEFEMTDKAAPEKIANLDSGAKSET